MKYFKEKPFSQFRYHTHCKIHFLCPTTLRTRIFELYPGYIEDIERIDVNVDDHDIIHMTYSCRLMLPKSPLPRAIISLNNNIKGTFLHHNYASLPLIRDDQESTSATKVS